MRQHRAWPSRWPWGRVVVAGRSMEPALRDGDWLAVGWRRAVRPGRLVVVRLPGGPLAVKRAFRRVAEGWWVERDNPGEGVDSGRWGRSRTRTCWVWCCSATGRRGAGVPDAR